MLVTAEILVASVASRGLGDVYKRQTRNGFVHPYVPHSSQSNSNWSTT